MKNFTLVLLALFCLASCEKQGTNYGTQGESGTINNDDNNNDNNNNDNNNNNNNNSLILGVWELNNVYNAVETEGYLNPSTNQQIETYNENYTSDYAGMDLNVFWEFTSDDIFIEYSNYTDMGTWYADTISYTLNGSDLLVNYSSDDEIDNWKINSINNSLMDVSLIDYDQWSSGDTTYYDESKLDIIFNKSQLPQFNDLRSVRITNKKEKSLYRK